MDIILNDQQISTLIQEKKILQSKNLKITSQLKDKKGHREKEIILPRKDGGFFKIILRMNNFNVLDFSIILGYIPTNGKALFRLKRFNGKSHEHTNKIEGNSFYNFHIHFATERYQFNGFDEDAYAVETNLYSDIHSALDYFINDCNIISSDDCQLKMF